MQLNFARNFIISISLFFFIQVTEAIEPLSTSELASHCSQYEKNPDGIDAVFCIRYIQGFIDGAIATDEKVALNAMSRANIKETFSERAIRIRKARKNFADPTLLTGFCLGTPIPLKSVVEKIINNFHKRKYNSKQVSARDAVYYILRKEYPCIRKEK